MSIVSLTAAIEDGAKCLDGSPVAYYIRRNESNPNWVVYFQGGTHATFSNILAT